MLGPYLFAVYMGGFTIGNCSDRMIFKFADDVSIVEMIFKNNSLNSGSTVNQVISWMRDHGLVENSNKRKQIIFHKKSQLHETSNVSLNINKIKILGVTWSGDLKWNSHIDEVISKAVRRMYAIRILLPIVDKNQIIQV